MTPVGERAGIVTIAAGEIAATAERHRVWTLGWDSLGVPSVTRYRIEPQ